MAGRRKVMVVFGTRPEAIKMAPVVRALSLSTVLEPVACATAQHRQMLDQVLETFALTPDYDLDLMRPNQTLESLTSRCMGALGPLFDKVRPAAVLVQGDTTTAFAAALSAFYRRIPVGHVEAGLRTYDTSSPFPEESNRRMIAALADWHFAPTEQSQEALRAERWPDESIFVTGNTSIDALLSVSRQPLEFPELRARFEGKRLILMTAHRRENFGAPLEAIFTAVAAFCADHPECHVIYPVHPNPHVQEPAERLLSGIANLSMIRPVEYRELVYLMRECALVLTDSGGLQEEAPALGKPVLVLRDTTERPEAVESGGALLVGCDPQVIRARLEELLQANSVLWQRMARVRHPFGDGRAAHRIAMVLENKLAQAAVVARA